MSHPVTRLERVLEPGNGTFVCLFLHPHADARALGATEPVPPAHTPPAQSVGSMVRQWPWARLRTYCAQTGDGPGQIFSHMNLAVSSCGDIVVCDERNFRVHVLCLTDTALTLAQHWNIDRHDARGVKQNPGCVAVSSIDEAYVSFPDPECRRVGVFQLDGTLVRSWSTQGHHASLRGFCLRVYGDQVWFIADQSRVHAFHTDGRLARSWPDMHLQKLDFTDLAVSPARGEVYVCDSRNTRIAVFDLDGGLLRSWGQGGTGPGDFDLYPSTIALSGTGEVLVTDETRVQVFSMDGLFVRCLAWPPAGAEGTWHNPHVAVTPAGEAVVNNWHHESFIHVIHVLPVGW